MLNQYFTDIIKSLNELHTGNIYQAINLLRSAQNIYTFGNGGSASTASHFAGDLSKGCGLRAFCLNDSIPLVTAWGNDCGYANIFSGQLNNLLKRNDVVFAISGSGKSLNILNGVVQAKAKKAMTIGLTAFDGGQLVGMVDVPIIVPVQNMERAEDIHLMICHYIKTQLMERA